jgi:DNA topoisomerase-3
VELVVAEKPSVARDIARVLGVRTSGKDAFEGTNHVITWCIGHLVELEEPAAYDPAWKSWRLDALPMLPSPFRLRPSAHAAGHLKIVRALLRDRRFTGVIDACDAGREGELIFRYVYQYAGARLPVRRLWISSMTDDAIRRGLATLRTSAQMDPLADAARSRSEADWLVGMNATRAVTVKNRAGGHTSLYSIGRVQTPTLAMIVQREQQIRAFVPRDYWEVRGQFDAAGLPRLGSAAEGQRGVVDEAGLPRLGSAAEGQRGVVDASFTALWRYGDISRLGTEEAAAVVVARDHAANDALVETVRAKTVREAPPMLFDLTTLQRTANRRFGFTATRTLELAQALYERHKVLTYPRTDSRHLSNDLIAELPDKFRTLAAMPEYAAFAEPLLADPPKPSRRVFDDAKVSDHHAIIPTGAPVGSLDRDEARLFDLVARRFLGVFHPDAEFAVTEAWIRVAGSAQSAPPKAEPSAILAAAPPPPDRYLARGRVRMVAGWQAVAGIEPRSGDGEGDEALLPALVEGQRLTGRYAARAKQTTPPPRYTEATLLGAMESAGKAIDDETLRAAMKDSGLGTPATRAAIIETLLKRDFIYRDHQNLVPTETGSGLIEALPVASLASPELTGTWEARLARIARGEDGRAAFMADIARYVTEMVDAVRASTPPPPPAGQPESAFGGHTSKWKKSSKQPGRGRGGGGRQHHEPTTPASPGIDERARYARLAPHGDGPRGTENSTSSRIALHHDASIIAALRATSRSEGSVSPTPRTPVPLEPIRAALQPNGPSRTAKSSTRSKSPKAAKPKAALTCPRCRIGTLLTGSRGWGCSRFRDGCRFVIWFDVAGHRITPTQLRDLVAIGKTKTFSIEHGGRGQLVLDAASDAPVQFRSS